MVTSTLKEIFDNDSRVLILGSYPSVMSRRAEFYYANPNNRFWKIMSTLFNVDFCSMTPNEKTETLLRLGIALSDVVHSCNIHASADSTITDVVASDIKTIIENSSVEHIFLNGKTAYGFFMKFFPEYAYMATCLPSTSPANATFGFDKLSDAWRIVAETLKR